MKILTMLFALTLSTLVGTSVVAKEYDGERQSRSFSRQSNDSGQSRQNAASSNHYERTPNMNRRYTRTPSTTQYERTPNMNRRYTRTPSTTQYERPPNASDRQYTHPPNTNQRKYQYSRTPNVEQKYGRTSNTSYRVTNVNENTRTLNTSTHTYENAHIVGRYNNAYNTKYTSPENRNEGRYGNNTQYDNDWDDDNHHHNSYCNHSHKWWNAIFYPSYGYYGGYYGYRPYVAYPYYPPVYYPTYYGYNYGYYGGTGWYFGLNASVAIYGPRLGGTFYYGTGY